MPPHHTTTHVTQFGLVLLLLSVVIAIGLALLPSEGHTTGEGFASRKSATTPAHATTTTPPDPLTTALAKLPTPTDEHLDTIRSLRDTQTKQLSFLQKGLQRSQSMAASHREKRQMRDHHMTLRLRQHPMPTDTRKVVTMLWSGGLASTFRLCELLFVQKRTVRPVFLASEDLDSRHSAYQERETVRRLVAYLHKHHAATVRDLLLQVQTIRCDKDQVGGMHTARNDPTNQETVRLWMTALERKTPHAITPFYVALARMPERQGVYDTFLRKGPIDLVLSEHTPHQMLLAAVKKWGTPVTAATATASTPYSCIYTVSPDPTTTAAATTTADTTTAAATTTADTTTATTTTTATATDAIARSAFARCVAHLRFVRPCSSSSSSATASTATVQEYAQKHGFADVLDRTWSCRDPQHTTKQRHTIRDSRLALPTPRHYSPPPRASPTSAIHRQWVRETAAMAASKPAPLVVDSPFPKPVGWVPCARCVSCLHRRAERIGPSYAGHTGR